MKSKFDKVIANLRDALAAAEELEIGGPQNRIVWLYPRELEALIDCAEVCRYYDSGINGIAGRAVTNLEACADE